jgi:hypothetical protein
MRRRPAHDGQRNPEPTVCFSKKYSLAGIPECKVARYVGYAPVV